MKRLFTALVMGGALLGAFVPAAFAKPVCLDLYAIDRFYTEGGKTLDFEMNTGEVYRNHLIGNCSDLVFNGFSWVVTGPSQVCEGTQTIQVRHSGQICTLGKFDPPGDRSIIAHAQAVGGN